MFGQQKSDAYMVKPHFAWESSILYPFFTPVEETKIEYDGLNHGFNLGIRRQMLKSQRIGLSMGSIINYMNHNRFEYIKEEKRNINGSQKVIEDFIGYQKYHHINLYLPLEMTYLMQSDISVSIGVYLSKEIVEQTRESRTNTEYYYYDIGYESYLPYFSPKVLYYPEKSRDIVSNEIIPGFSLGVGFNLANNSSTSVLFKFYSQFNGQTELNLVERMFSLGVSSKI